MLFYLREEKDAADSCINFIVFLQKEKETVEICTNVIVLQEEK